MLGEKLIKMGIITQTQLEECLAEQTKTGKRLGEVLVAKAYATQKQIEEALAAP